MLHRFRSVYSLLTMPRGYGHDWPILGDVVREDRYSVKSAMTRWVVFEIAGYVMTKIFGFAAGIVFLVVGIVQGVDLQKASRMGASNEPINIEQVLNAQADKLNKNKGKRCGHSTFDGAYVRGSTLVLEYLVSLSPRNVNTAKAADTLREGMKKLMCKGQMLRALDQGAAIEVSYRTKRNQQFLFEVRVNASSCRENA